MASYKKPATLSGHNIIVDRYCKSVVSSYSAENGKKTRSVLYMSSTIQKASQIKLKWREQYVTMRYKDIRSTCPKEKPLPCSMAIQSIAREFRTPQCVYERKKLKKKSHRSIKKINQLINLFYENRDKTKKFYWLTLTTAQHKSGLNDMELYYQLKLYLQHRRIDYICVAERQRATQDLHFHLLVQQGTDFNIRAEVARWKTLMAGYTNEAGFNVKRVFSAKLLVAYIAKYVRKPCPTWKTINYQYENQGKTDKNGRIIKCKPPYSSLFECRTFSYSGGLGKLYNEKHHTFRLSLPNDYLTNCPGLFKIKHKTDYYTVYEYTNELWALASREHSIRQKIITDKDYNVMIMQCDKSYVL